ncbi:hypothetical protein [Limosilactobacillus fermentum]
MAKERAKAEEWQQKLASAKERLASLQEADKVSVTQPSRQAVGLS